MDQPARVTGPVVVFVVATLVASGLLLAVQGATGVDPAVQSHVQLAPAVGALVTWLVHRARLRTLLPAPVSPRELGTRTALAAGACLLYAVLVLGLTLATGAPVSGAVAVGSVPFAVVALAQLLGAAGEETGWRGLLQPLLERRTSRLRAALLTGAVWAVWHVQAFAAGAGVAVAFVVATLAFAVLLASLGSGSVVQRVVVATLAHWLVNLALLVVAGERTGELAAVVVNAVAMVVTTGLVLAVARARRPYAGVAAAPVSATSRG
ncbi:CPBP family intramembrane glutamic endopeptidase [Cellulomonas cellasea]|uniref:CAAX prenyl protease 2/Lysostaphin resistance protein A-like domain-containing protein n=2 Tax=Cellulomonas cellasea TaxID=43670 RepID=A0A0A0B5V9_9CELL|nr:CPBP family intramembrane glutamic endopeptidase [Cellulomonas cellasea]KGM01563.1 hypothetical protein Q760_18550 [Cellulomonas cellasea DSM 20118]GEA87905.1 hypothetical protein CCE01nite_18540 [Cellulomonas cellasea]